ncbi:MAG: DUF4190 domain-containing protein [Hamadaea sp.]|nr:DUF4190 domain-containing protein [Hamadaea sp.]
MTDVPPPTSPTNPVTGQPLHGYVAPAGYGMPYQPYPVARPTNGMAIASLVTSLAMIAVCTPLSILGVIFGHIAKRQIRETGEDGAGLATAGIIIGWIFFLLPILIIALFIGLGLSGAFDSPEPYNY